MILNKKANYNKLSADLKKIVPIVHVDQIHKFLKFKSPCEFPKAFLEVSLKDWKMNIQDKIIISYLYKNFQPKRHLEFGTWKGDGVILCLENSTATVWTINLWEGEKDQSGKWFYSEPFKKLVEFCKKKNTEVTSDAIIHQTDALDFIGYKYKTTGLGNRVCQIYADSREWDIANYPAGFFDSCLIDGGHTKDVVQNDTEKAIALVKKGGLIMWHDFCPEEEVLLSCSAPRGVCEYVLEDFLKIQKHFKSIFWIYPSWLLVGIKK